MKPTPDNSVAFVTPILKKAVARGIITDLQYRQLVLLFATSSYLNGCTTDSPSKGSPSNSGSGTPYRSPSPSMPAAMPPRELYTAPTMAGVVPSPRSNQRPPSPPPTHDAGDNWQRIPLNTGLNSEPTSLDQPPRMYNNDELDPDSGNDLVNAVQKALLKVYFFSLPLSKSQYLSPSMFV